MTEYRGLAVRGPDATIYRTARYHIDRTKKRGKETPSVFPIHTAGIDVVQWYINSGPPVVPARFASESRFEEPKIFSFIKFLKYFQTSI